MRGFVAHADAKRVTKTAEWQGTDGESARGARLLCRKSGWAWEVRGAHVQHPRAAIQKSKNPPRSLANGEVVEIKQNTDPKVGGPGGKGARRTMGQ